MKISNIDLDLGRQEEYEALIIKNFQTPFSKKANETSILDRANKNSLVID